MMLSNRLLALVVLLGLATSLVVAWGFAVAGGTMDLRGAALGVRDEGYVSVWRWEGRGALFLDVHAGLAIEQTSLEDEGARTPETLVPPGLRNAALPWITGSAPWPARGTTDMRAVDARGWPVVCLWSMYTFGEDGKAIPHGAIPIPRNGVVKGGRSEPYPMALPCRPIWRGLAINTAAFAGAWWGLLFIPYTLRADARRRRGACVRCGYDLAGLSRCPECGREAPAGEAGGNGIAG